MSGELLGLCGRLGIDKPGAAPDLVRKSFTLLQHESVLLLALGYDYWFNPFDQKAIGLYAIVMPDADREEYLPTLNISKQEILEIKKLWYLPDLPIKKEFTEEAINPDISQRITRGGVLMGGTGNFNLCTQAIDLIAKSFDSTGVSSDLIRKLPGASATLDGSRRQIMVKCYKYLRGWWSDGDLIKVGLTDR